jgi:hypothetical protein
MKEAHEAHLTKCQPRPRSIHCKTNRSFAEYVTAGPKLPPLPPISRRPHVYRPPAHPYPLPAILQQPHSCASAPQLCRRPTSISPHVAVVCHSLAPSSSVDDDSHLKLKATTLVHPQVSIDPKPMASKDHPRS